MNSLGLLLAANTLSPMTALMLQLTSIGFCVALGMMIALRIRRRGVKPWAWRPVAEAMSLEPERAHELLTLLHETTTRAADDVREHSRRLFARSTSDPAEVQELLNADQELARRLDSTRELIEQHALDIKCQLDQLLLDAVSGIQNRRAFDSEMRRRFVEWQRYGRPFSLILLDIDHFKHVNDEHGHPEGDRLLRAIGRVLLRELREIDTPARIGGDEFAAILPETELADAGALGDRLRTEIANLQIDSGGTPISVTMSVGVSSIVQCSDVETMIRQADEALYASKRSERNCTHASDGQVSTAVSA